MDINEIKTLVRPFIDKETDFQIVIDQLRLDGGREYFNKTIREKVDKRHGVYVWSNTATGEVVYIGMAGKFKADGKPCTHSIQNRLVASRGKISGTDIQTNDYVRYKMTDHNINSLTFSIMYTKADEPPAYVEALLLYEFFKRTKNLPKFNSSF